MFAGLDPADPPRRPHIYRILPHATPHTPRRLPSAILYDVDEMVRLVHLCGRQTLPKFYFNVCAATPDVYEEEEEEEARV